MIGNITIQGIRIPLTASIDGMLEKLTDKQLGWER